MSALTCDICGGKLIMQTGALVKCESCGMEYTKERMQEKVQEIKGTVKVDGPIETIKGEAEKERLLKNAETFIQIKDFDKSKSLYLEVTKQYPEDYRGWFGLLTFYCKYCSNIPSRYTNYNQSEDHDDLYHKICKCANTIVALTNDRNIFDSVIATMGEFFERVAKISPCYYFEIFTRGYKYLKAFKPNFSEIYKEVFGYEKTKSRFDALNNDIKQLIVKSVWPSNTLHQPTGTDYSYYCTFVFRNQIGLGFSMPYWDANPEEVVNISDSFDKIIDETIKNHRISKELCVQCGGSFKGFFKQTCTQCGKPKDY